MAHYQRKWYDLVDNFGGLVHGEGASAIVSESLSGNGSVQLTIGVDGNSSYQFQNDAPFGTLSGTGKLAVKWKYPEGTTLSQPPIVYLAPQGNFSVYALFNLSPSQKYVESLPNAGVGGDGWNVSILDLANPDSTVGAWDAQGVNAISTIQFTIQGTGGDSIIIDRGIDIYPTVRPLVVFNVDDNHTTWVSRLLPELDNYNIPCTFNIIQSLLDAGPNQLTTAELTTLYEAGHRFTPHWTAGYNTDGLTPTQWIAQANNERDLGLAFAQGLGRADQYIPWFGTLPKGEGNRSTMPALMRANGYKYARTASGLSVTANTSYPNGLPEPFAIRSYEPPNGLGSEAIAWVNARIVEGCDLISIHGHVFNAAGSGVVGNQIEIDEAVEYLDHLRTLADAGTVDLMFMDDAIKSLQQGASSTRGIVSSIV